MRSWGSTWKAQGRPGASAKGPGLKESKPALLCSLIPRVPGVHSSCQIQAQRPPTLPSSLLPPLPLPQGNKFLPWAMVDYLEKSPWTPETQPQPQGSQLGCNHTTASRSRCTREKWRTLKQDM